MKILYWTASCCQKVLYKVSIVTQCLLSKPLLMSFKLEDISLQVDSTTKNYFCLRSASPFIINCAACAGINGQRCSNIISTKEVYFFPLTLYQAFVYTRGVGYKSSDRLQKCSVYA